MGEILELQNLALEARDAEIGQDIDTIKFLREIQEECNCKIKSLINAIGNNN